MEITASASMLVSKTSSASCTLMGTRIVNLSLLLLRDFFPFKTGYWDPSSSSSHRLLLETLIVVLSQAFPSVCEFGVWGSEAAMAAVVVGSCDHKGEPVTELMLFYRDKR